MNSATVPQTTAQAVPAAITSALKANRLAAYPPTAMTIPSSTYGMVLEGAAAEIRQRGIAFRRDQLINELRNRGYVLAGSRFGNGPVVAPVPGAGLETREVEMARAKAAATKARLIASIRANALPIGIAAAAGLVLILAYRYEKKKGRR